MPLPIDLEKDFIELPCVAGARPASAELGGILLAELPTPLPHGLVGHHHAACSQQLFEVTKAEVEAEVQPNCVDDDFLREAKALVEHRHGGVVHNPSIA